MTADIPPPENFPEPGYYYHFKHDYNDRKHCELGANLADPGNASADKQ